MALSAEQARYTENVFHIALSMSIMIISHRELLYVIYKE